MDNWKDRIFKFLYVMTIIIGLFGLMATAIIWDEYKNIKHPFVCDNEKTAKFILDCYEKLKEKHTSLTQRQCGEQAREIFCARK